MPKSVLCFVSGLRTSTSYLSFYKEVYLPLHLCTRRIGYLQEGQRGIIGRVWKGRGSLQHQEHKIVYDWYKIVYNFVSYHKIFANFCE